MISGLQHAGFYMNRHGGKSQSDDKKYGKQLFATISAACDYTRSYKRVLCEIPQHIHIVLNALFRIESIGIGVVLSGNACQRTLVIFHAFLELSDQCYLANKNVVLSVVW